MYIVGLMSLLGVGTDKNVEVTYKWWDKVMQEENGHVLCEIGVHLYDGIYIERDIKKALEYFKLAASRGIIKAMSYLCVMYIENDGIEPNYVESFEWGKMAAEKGEPLPMRVIAKFYHDGEIVQKNDEEAKKWLIKASNSSDEDVSTDAKKDLKKWYNIVL